MTLVYYACGNLDLFHGCRMPTPGHYCPAELVIPVHGRRLLDEHPSPAIRAMQAQPIRLWAFESIIVKNNVAYTCFTLGGTTFWFMTGILGSELNDSDAIVLVMAWRLISNKPL